MRITIDNLHREYYENEGLITFEEILSPKQLELIQQEMGHLKGIAYDLWRKSEPLKKALKLKQLAMIAAELTDHRPVRLGFDLLLTPSAVGKTVKELSSIQGLLSGLLLDLSEGTATYLKPDTPIPDLEGKPYLLIAFTEESAVYIYQESDPNTHYLKQFGYSFGDRIKHSTHPILYQ